MGLLDKLFGGNKSSGESPSAPPPPSPTPDGPIPLRRERTKPGEVPAVAATPDAPPAPDAPTLPQLPMDGENAELLAAINAVIASDNPETRHTLYATLLQSQLLLVSMSDEEIGTGQVELKEGQQLSLATIRDPQGKVYLPAFTDIHRLAGTLPEKGARYVKLPATSVCGMFLQGGGEGIVINPGMPPSGLITRGEAEILATNNIPEFDENGQLKTTAQQQMRIAIGKPATPPAESFVEAIRAQAAELPLVREVYLFQAGIENQPPRLMIGVLMDDGLTPEEMHPNFESIGKAAYEARGETEAFDMMPLNDQMIEAIQSIEGKIYARGS